MIDPHGMDPQTVLRFVKAVGGWPGKVVMVACEPADVEEMGMGLERRGGGRRGPRGQARARDGGGAAVHELSVSSAILDTALRHAAGRAVTVVELTVGALRQVVPDSLGFYWDIVTRDTDCEGARLDQTEVEARVRCDACGARVDAGRAGVPLPGVRRARTWVCRATSSAWSRSRSRRRQRNAPHAG